MFNIATDWYPKDKSKYRVSSHQERKNESGLRNKGKGHMWHILYHCLYPQTVLFFRLKLTTWPSRGSCRSLLLPISIAVQKASRS